MGPHCFVVYSHLARRAFTNPELKHSILDLKSASNLGAATVSRSFEVLAHFGLIQLIRCGGSQKSKCKLLDTVDAAKRLGATYQKRSLSWSLPDETKERLQAECEAIRQRQQGKPQRGAKNACGNLLFTVSQRNARVSLTTRQSSTRETQTGNHLLKEERIERSPSPTPSHDGEAQKNKDSPDEEEPDPLLRWARIKITGVMKDMVSHLLDTSKPQKRRFANGFGEWEKFGLNSLAVEAVQWRGEVLELVLSASDPAAAGRGLYKYRKTWEPSLRKWFECEVEVELRQAKRKR